MISETMYLFTPPPPLTLSLSPSRLCWICVWVCAVIQGILESVRWLRKLNTDQEGRRPGLDGVGGRGELFGGRRSQDTHQ